MFEDIDYNCGSLCKERKIPLIYFCNKSWEV